METTLLLFSYKITPEFVISKFVIAEFVIIFHTEFIVTFMLILVKMLSLP